MREKEVYLRWLKNGSEQNDRWEDEYKNAKSGVKRLIKKKKKEAIESFGKKMNEDAIGNRKLFWKEVKRQEILKGIVVRVLRMEVEEL